LAYDENDFLLRKAYPKYEGWKTIENLTISAGLNKENLEAYVICSGIIYGKGEEVLEYHFRSAWINDPLNLPYIDTGENWIPMIYIVDLARLVKFTSENLPDSHYLIAADNSED